MTSIDVSDYTGEITILYVTEWKDTYVINLLLLINKYQLHAFYVIFVDLSHPTRINKLNFIVTSAYMLSAD